MFDSFPPSDLSCWNRTCQGRQLFAGMEGERPLYRCTECGYQTAATLPDLREFIADGCVVKIDAPLYLDFPNL